MFACICWIANGFDPSKVQFYDFPIMSYWGTLYWVNNKMIHIWKLSVRRVQLRLSGPCLTIPIIFIIQIQQPIIYVVDLDLDMSWWQVLILGLRGANKMQQIRPSSRRSYDILGKQSSLGHSWGQIWALSDFRLQTKQKWNMGSRPPR